MRLPLSGSVTVRDVRLHAEEPAAVFLDGRLLGPAAGEHEEGEGRDKIEVGKVHRMVAPSEDGARVCGDEAERDGEIDMEASRA